MTRHSLWAACALLLALAGCVELPPTTVRKHPDFGSRRRVIENIVVLPPQVELEQPGNSRPDLSVRVSAELVELVERTLDERGFETVAHARPGTSSDEGDLRDVHASVDAALMWPDLLSVEAANAFRATLGTSVLLSKNEQDADALLLIRLRGRAEAVSPEPGGAAEACALHLVIVDRRSSDILWANLASSSSPIPASYSRKAVRRLVEEAMDPLSCAYRSASRHTGKVCHHVPAASKSRGRNGPVGLRGASR